jgi:hypothetical protein
MNILRTRLRRCLLPLLLGGLSTLLPSCASIGGYLTVGLDDPCYAPCLTAVYADPTCASTIIRRMAAVRVELSGYEARYGRSLCTYSDYVRARSLAQCEMKQLTLQLARLRACPAPCFHPAHCHSVP